MTELICKKIQYKGIRKHKSKRKRSKLKGKRVKRKRRCTNKIVTIKNNCKNSEKHELGLNMTVDMNQNDFSKCMI